ncbi:hypothetical protein Tco_0226369 [Tanacetum coccineum]
MPRIHIFEEISIDTIPSSKQCGVGFQQKVVVVVCLPRPWMPNGDISGGTVRLDVGSGEKRGGDERLRRLLRRERLAEDRYRGRGYDKGQEVEQKHVKIMEDRIDKVVNMTAGDSYDALVYCVENMIEDRIMDYGASFHATYCKEEFKRFKLRSGKVRLAYDKTLDIASVGDHQSLGDMSRIGMNMLASKGNALDVQKSKFIQKAMALYLLHQSNDPATMILLSKTAAGVTNGIVMLKMVPETPLQFGVAKRLSQTFRAESTRLRAEALKIDSDEMRYIFRDKKSHHVIQSRDVTFVDSIYEARSSYTSKGSKNIGSFKDSRRSDEEYSEDGASCKEGGSETPQVRRSTRESRAPVRYSLSANYLLLTEDDEPKSYSEALSSKESVQ